MLGFALGAWTNSLYVDLTGDLAFLSPSFENGNAPLGEEKGCGLGFRAF